MAVITPDTFDPLRAYISVRLLQGVPLVDADWNEAHDVRKFEVQAFLKWFVGNGVPEGNDGFRIADLTSVDVEDDVDVWDFVIQRGVGAAPDGISPVEQGLRHVGRCLVDGMDVLIAANINFRAQPLHVSRGRAATDLASLLGVPRIAEIPVGDDPVVVYLDVWERLVTPEEEPGLVHSGLGVESCARLKREWVVRARAGSSVPTPTDPTNPDDPNRFIAGHSYYALAIIAEQASVPITDQREQRLLLPPATLIEDLFGPVRAEDYRRGQGRPLVNLREAINALLRGELPGIPEASLGPQGGARLLRGTFFDAANGLITTWLSGSLPLDPPYHVSAARLSLAEPEKGFGSIKQITGPIGPSLHATLLDTGEVLLIYATEASTIEMKRGTLDTLTPNSPVITVTDTAASETSCFAVAVGGQVLIFWWEDTSNTWQCKWYRYHQPANPFSRAFPLSDLEGVPSLTSLHAAADSTNKVWVAFEIQSSPSHSEIRAIVVPLGGSPGEPQQLELSNGSDKHPFVMVDNTDNVWVFWRTSTGEGSSIWYRRFLQETRRWESTETQVPGTSSSASSATLVAFTAVSDAQGGVWLFWTASSPIATTLNMLCARHNPVTQGWGVPRQITSPLGLDAASIVLRGPDSSLWLFWDRIYLESPIRVQPFYRRIFPSI